MIPSMFWGMRKSKEHEKEATNHNHKILALYFCDPFPMFLFPPHNYLHTGKDKK